MRQDTHKNKLNNRAIQKKFDLLKEQVEIFEVEERLRKIKEELSKTK